MDHSYREIRKLSHDMDRYSSVVYHLLQQGQIETAMSE